MSCKTMTATMNSEYSSVAGWYGKIPSLGDFVSRRLPPDFINTWDTWLQQGMAISRTQLGECWVDLYMTSLYGASFSCPASVATLYGQAYSCPV